MEISDGYVSEYSITILNLKAMNKHCIRKTIVSVYIVRNSTFKL